jgi:hypothetical protein
MVVGREFKLSAIVILFGIVMLASQTTSQTLASSTSNNTIIQVHGKPYNITVNVNSLTFSFANPTSAQPGKINETTNSNNVTSFFFGFNVTGSHGSPGFANVTICHTSGFFPPGQINKINMYMNNTKINATQTSSNLMQAKCVWLSYNWTYHSTESLTMNISLAVPLQQTPTFDGAIPLLAVATLSIAGYALSKQRIPRRK